MIAPNKKPLACAKGYAFRATGAFHRAPAAEPNAPATGALSHGITR